MRGSDAKPVADGDLQRLDDASVLHVAADLDNHAFGIWFPREMALAHEMGQRPRLGPGARQHVHRRLARLVAYPPRPILDQAGQGVFLVMANMESSPLPPCLDGRCRIAIAQRLRRQYLPWCNESLLKLGSMVGENSVPLLPLHRHGPVPGPLPRLAERINQNIFQIRFLAPDFVHPGAARHITDKTQSRSRLHRLLLACVPREHDLRPVALPELQDVMRLTGRQHSRLVDHDQGALADLHLTARRHLQELVDADRPGIAIVAQCHSCAPGHRRGYDLVAVLPMKICNRTQRRGLARARRALDHRHAGTACRGETDRPYLLLAQGIAVRKQSLHLGPDRLGGEHMAGIVGHVLGHVAHRLFHAQIVACRITLRMGHTGVRFGGGLGQHQGLDLRVAAHPLDGRHHRLPAQQARRTVRRRFHHVRALEYCFFARQIGR